MTQTPKIKSVHNPCPYGNDDCPKCGKTPKTKSEEEDMRDYTDAVYGLVKKDVLSAYQFYLAISSIIKEREEAIVEEIKNKSETALGVKYIELNDVLSILKQTK